MNETNQDKIWKLAASKEHNEATESEVNELNKLIIIPEIQESISELHPRIKQSSLHNGTHALLNYRTILRYPNNFEKKHAS